MRTTRRQFSTASRISATILCLSFTWTQAAPAWALRPVEPERGTPGAVGLEEALQPRSAATVQPSALRTLGSFGIPVGDVPIASVRVPMVPAATTIPANSPLTRETAPTLAVDGYLFIHGLAERDGAITLFTDGPFQSGSYRAYWPVVQMLVDNPTAAVKQWQEGSLADLAKGIKDGQNAAVAAAILRGCALCATRGEAPSLAPTYSPDETPITAHQFQKIIDLVKANGIAQILDHSETVYLADPEKINLSSDSANQGAMTFVTVTAGRRNKMDVLLTSAEATTARGHLANVKEHMGRRPALPEELDDEKAMEKARQAYLKARGAWATKQAQLEQERRNLGRSVLVRALGSSVEVRDNLFDLYAGGQDRVKQFLELSWKLKQFNQFTSVFKNGNQRAALLRFSKQLKTVIDEEERLVETRDREIVALADQEIVRSRLVDLKDIAWNIENDVVGNVARVAELGDIDVNRPYQAQSIPPQALRSFWSATMLLNGIDYRMETRGRDSLGLSIIATFANQRAYEEYRSSLNEEMRSILSDGSASTVFKAKHDGRDYEVERITHVRPGINRQGEPDPEAPVTVNIVYRKADVVGSLGENAGDIRRVMIEDLIFQRMVLQPLQNITFIIHSRWASEGTISIPNTHPEDNRGIYVLGPGYQDGSYTAEPLEGGRFRMAATLKGTLPHYGRNGIIQVVLNGDIENFNTERLSRYGYFPDLTKDYLKAKGMWESRNIDEAVTTDTKLIPLRIEHYLLQGYDLQEAVRRAARDFDGSFAIQVQSDLEPGKIFLAMNGEGQGLYVGVSPDGFHPASETYGFVDLTQKFYRVRPGQLVVIDQAVAPVAENLTVIDVMTGRPVKLTENNLETTTQTTRDVYLPKEKYQHFFAKEISEAAKMWKDTIFGKTEIVTEADGTRRAVINLGEEEMPEVIRQELQSGRYKRVIVAGMGTALAAGEVGVLALREYLSRLAVRHELEIEVDLAPELTAYHLKGMPHEKLMTDTLVIVVSQSGKTADTNQFLRAAINRGARALGIINARASEAAFMIQDSGGGVLFTGTGRDIEIAVASTKAYYAQIAAGIIYAMKIAQLLGVPDDVFIEDIEEMHRMPEKMQAFEQSVTASNGEHPLIKAAEFFPLYKPLWAIVSSGPGMAAALESLIKLSELCYQSIYETAFTNQKHVNFSAETMTLILAANLHGMDDFVQRNLKGEIGKMIAHPLAPILVTTEDDHRFDKREVKVVDPSGRETKRPMDIIRVPTTTERFAPVLLTMASHLFAYYIALNMNKRGDELANAITAVADKRKALKARGMADEALLKDGEFRGTVRREFQEIYQAIRQGRYNAGARVQDMVELANLVAFAAGDLDLAQAEFYLGPDAPKSAAGILDRCEEVASAISRRQRRPVDTIAHQAKYVTVGSKAAQERPGDVMKFVEALRERGNYRDSEILGLVHGYQMFRATGQPWTGVIPHPNDPLRRSVVLVVAADQAGELAMASSVLAEHGINISSSISGKANDGQGEVGVVVERVDRPITAIQNLGVLEEIERRLTMGKGGEGVVQVPTPIASVSLNEAGQSKALEPEGQPLGSDAVGQLQGILEDLTGGSAGLEETKQLVEATLHAAQPRLARASELLRRQYPTLPADLPIIIQIGGDPLTPRQQAGQITISVHALRHPLLLFAQMEYGAVHQLLYVESKGLQLPETMVPSDATAEDVKQVLVEVAALATGLGRLASSSEESQALFLKAIQRADPAGQYGRLRSLREFKQLQAGASWAGPILDYVQRARPEASKIAAWLLQQHQVSEHRAFVERPIAALRRAIDRIRNYQLIEWDEKTRTLVASPVARPANGHEEIRLYFGNLADNSPKLFQRVHDAYDAFVAGEGNVFIESHPDNPSESAIIVVMYDHQGIDDAITDISNKINPATGKRFNFDVNSGKVIKGNELSRPVAVVVYTVQAPLNDLVHAGVVEPTRQRLRKIAQEEQQEWSAAQSTLVGQVGLEEQPPVEGVRQEGQIQSIESLGSHGQQLGIERALGPYWVTKGGALIDRRVNLELISDRAVLEPGVVLVGGRAAVEAGAHVSRAFIDNTPIREGADVREAIVSYDPNEHEGWELAPGSPFRVESRPTDIAPNARVSRYRVLNATVGEKASIVAEGGYVGWLAHGGVGAGTHARIAKIQLADVPKNSAIGNFDQNGKDTGPVEVTDFVGVQPGLRIGQVGRNTQYYIEYAEGFFLPVVVSETPGVALPRRAYRPLSFLPGFGIQGDRSIMLEFSGTLDPRVTEVQRINGKGKSGHGILAAGVGWVMGGGSRLVGTLDYWQRENLNTTQDVVHKYDRTYLGSFAFVPAPGFRYRDTEGRERVANGEAWGRVGNFSLRADLGAREGEVIGWVLDRAADLVLSQMAEEFQRWHGSWTSDQKAQFDHMLEDLIATEIDWLNDEFAALAGKSDAKSQQRRVQVEAGIQRLRGHLESGAWRGEWAIEGDAAVFGTWRRRPDGRWVNTAGTYRGSSEQYTLDQLVPEAAVQYPRQDWYPALTPEDWQRLDVLFTIPEHGSVEGTVHPTAHVHSQAEVQKGARVGAGAIIGPGAVVEAGAVVEPGAEVLFSRVESGAMIRQDAHVYGVVVEKGATVARGATLRMGIVGSVGGAQPSQIGEGVQLDFFKVDEGSIIGKGSRGASTLVNRGSKVGPKNTLAAFSRVEGSETREKEEIGGRLRDSRWHANYQRDAHFATDIKNEVIEPYRWARPKDGKRGTVHLVTTHGAYTTVRGATISGAFSAGKNVSPEGASITLGFAKGNLAAGEQVRPLMFSSGPGLDKKVIADLLERFPYLYRHVLDYAFKTADADGKWVLQYLIEGAVVRETRWVLEQLAAYGGLAPALAGSIDATFEAIETDFLNEEVVPMSSELRARLNAHIKQVSGALTALVTQERAAPAVTLNGSYSRLQLLEGLDRLLSGLDGRWRLRYDAKADELVFTDGKWLYNQQTGRYSWQPATAGLEQAAVVTMAPAVAPTITLPGEDATVTWTVALVQTEIPSVVEAHKILILGPEALPIVETWPFLRPRDGQPIPFVAIVRDDAQEQAVRARFDALKVQPKEIVNLHGDLAALSSVADQLMAKYALQEGVVWDPLVVYTMDHLLMVARFLGVPEPVAFAQAAAERLRQQRDLERLYQ